METEKIRKAAYITVFTAGVAAVLYFWGSIIWESILPFLLGWLVSLAICPLASKLSKKFHIKTKFMSGFLMLLCVIITFLLIGFLAKKLWDEGIAFIERFIENPELVEQAVAKFDSSVKGMFEKFTIFERLGKIKGLENFASSIEHSISEISTKLSSFFASKLSQFATGAISRIPGALLFWASFLLSAFYFCIDSDKCKQFFLSVIPSGLKKSLPAIKDKFGKTLGGYLKGYLILMGITFAEVLFGLLVMGIDYAFLVAAVIALVDILPILGAGTVLVPWAIYAFAVSDTKRAIGLLILFTVISIIRQIAEPKIIGKNVGLHPLAMLASVYIGIKFIGFSGLFIGPFIALIIKEILEISKKGIKET